jgi:hypothetical protein
VEGHPGVHLPDLARAVNNLSARLAAVGRTRDALAAANEAVAMCDSLPQASPDSYLAELGNALDRRFIRLARLNRGEEARAPAVGAVSVYRDLARRFPDAHRPNHARNLHCPAGVLGARAGDRAPLP